MSKKELNGLLDGLGIKNAFLGNWESFHKKYGGFHEADEYGILYSMDMEEFAKSFSSVETSFIWASTLEGQFFWNAMDYAITARTFTREARLATQAILLCRKKGLNFNEETIGKYREAISKNKCKVSIELVSIGKATNAYMEIVRANPQLTEKEAVRKTAASLERLWMS